MHIHRVICSGFRDVHITDQMNRKSLLFTNIFELLLNTAHVAHFNQLRSSLNDQVVNSLIHFML